jgi:hypothetical protein
MLETAKITNPTGNAYMPGSHTTASFIGNRVELVNYPLTSNETGEESRLAVSERSNYTQSIPLYELLTKTTGADIYDCLFLFTNMATVVSNNSITNASFFIEKAVQVRKKLSQLISVPLHESSLSSNKQEISDIAQKVHQSSGLDVTTLAQVFKVSRATYHNWLKGFPASRKHRNHMLEIQPLIEEAAQRLGTPEAVSTWLLTPLSPGGKKPIEYLAEKHYDLFRGFLLHQRTGKEQFRPLKPSKRVFKSRKREDIEDVREQLRPHTWYDEDNDL